MGEKSLTTHKHTHKQVHGTAKIYILQIIRTEMILIRSLLFNNMFKLCYKYNFFIVVVVVLFLLLVQHISDVILI